MKNHAKRTLVKKEEVIDVNTYVKCPFYKKHSNKGKIDQVSITCEPIIDKSISFRNIFLNEKTSKEHMNEFCKSDCWKECPVAEIIFNKYR